MVSLEIANQVWKNLSAAMGALIVQERRPVKTKEGDDDADDEENEEENGNDDEQPSKKRAKIEKAQPAGNNKTNV